MTAQEVLNMQVWVVAGVGKRLKPDDYTPHASVIRKGYLVDHGDGYYSLTRRGAAHSEPRRADLRI